MPSRNEVNIYEGISKEHSRLTMEGYDVNYVILGAEEYLKLKMECSEMLFTTHNPRMLSRVVKLNTNIGELRVVQEFGRHKGMKFGE